ncbi:hypothetical protein SAMN04489729_4799 [Amycolatopsis lurida]|uniref:Uncharacterized protein n=1 Tax=Amycolatopsis lurida NRRL 2430 TaxID=1460371 RepID=A0A2P2FWB6_AMYLU|nr:hypothetical protein [Amycolatopsis lurida]KFU81026.1 hypothetical protein BB31_11635 [Amycolatopsis lurida NRRL 2430]SED59937.1 hypothetical protein SAMN04489729_4799 [Amycolatopsis lurida]
MTGQHHGPVDEPGLGARLAATARRFWKLLGAVAGGATGVGFASVLDAAGVDVSPSGAAGIALVLAAIGTWRAPRNTTDLAEWLGDLQAHVAAQGGDPDRLQNSLDDPPPRT